MNKEDYIKSIEKLNAEQLEFFHSVAFKSYRENAKLKEQIKSNQYASIYDQFYDRVVNKIFSKHKNEYISPKNISFYKERIISKDELNKVNNSNKVVYTCVVNNYDVIKDPLVITDNTEYIVFTDDVKSIESSIWKVKKIPFNIYNKLNGNYTLINRYIKMHPRELFPNYDYALYIDGNIDVISDLTEVFALSNSSTGIAMHIHNSRYDVYDEGFHCIKRNKGNKDNILKLLEKLKSEDFPRYYGLCEACIFSVNLNDDLSLKLLDEWWEQFLLSKTYRDQLLFPYVLWLNGLIVEEMGILGNDVTLNPKFKKRQHINFS